MIYSFPKIELAIFSTKISSKSTRYRIDRNQCDGKFLLNFKTGKWTSKKNPRPLKKISPSDEKEFEPFKFYAPVNVPARKSRIFCFRGVFTIREGMKEGWIEPLPPELTSRYRSLASYYPPAHLRCARARAHGSLQAPLSDEWNCDTLCRGEPKHEPNCRQDYGSMSVSLVKL